MTDHALYEELFAPLGHVVVRRMFSGSGLFLDGVMFAIAFDDGLYFKTDPDDQSAFEAEGMAPFSYDRKTGRRIVTSLWRAPERLLDEPDEMLAWARRAIAAARRKQSVKSRNPATAPRQPKPKRPTSPDRVPTARDSARKAKKPRR